MPDAPIDLQRAHRWFAVEFNNRAWELLERAERSADDTDQMLDLAHAAAVHWQQAGTRINQARAACLLATAYAACELGERAVHFADKCLRLSGEATEELTPFDRAAGFGCAANAYACQGDGQQARQFYEQGRTVAATLEPDDRQVFEQFYPPPNA
jgi:hypothetical protein